MTKQPDFDANRVSNRLDRRQALRALVALCSGVALTASGCAGYQIGRIGLYNTEIKTVCVPMVEANTYREAFAERLTEAICKKITEQTPYQLASAGAADSELSVKLVSETQTVAALNRYDDTREKTDKLVAVATWRDLRDGSYGSSFANSLDPNSNVTIVSDSYLVPEMGQSTATAQQEAIDKLAEQIVGLMEIAW